MAGRREPEAVGGVLRTCLDGIAGSPGAAEIWRVWPEAVGPHIARRAEPVRLRGRTLVVAVASAPWMQELALLKPRVRDELNSRLSRPLVDDLHFVLTEGDRATAAATPPPRRRPSSPPPRDVDLSAAPPPLRRQLEAILQAWRKRAGA
jgi:hypothetical protein